MLYRGRKLGNQNSTSAKCGEIQRANKNKETRKGPKEFTVHYGTVIPACLSVCLSVCLSILE
uniref:Uncharacterized protein n=1 Tax=Physcomitrium patens TaxID=3218 RepID=A0A2K1KCG4_PHYPA|nr:hypothetical protein PHYPA_010663 [Physcomitrium patens]